jgi:hypothetical protein
MPVAIFFIKILPELLPHFTCSFDIRRDHAAWHHERQGAARADLRKDFR